MIARIKRALKFGVTMAVTVLVAALILIPTLSLLMWLSQVTKGWPFWEMASLGTLVFGCIMFLFGVCVHFLCDEGGDK